MSIDWFTVIAQIINFVILVGLLKRFLYKPILNAIDERENRIAMQIMDAETKMSDAAQALDTYQKKNRAFENQRKDMLNDAKEEADNKRLTLIKAAKEELDDLRARFIRSLENEQQQIVGEIKQRVSDEVFSITRKTLKDLASVNLEEQIIETFIKRLKNLQDPDRKRIVEALKFSPQHIAINSFFEIPAPQQTKLIESVEELVSKKVQINFNTDQLVVGGIELTTVNYKMAWSIADYLSSLGEVIHEVLHSGLSIVGHDIKQDE